jgi:hypothetical protein
MPFSNDAMTLLRARRDDLYGQLRRMDDRVVAAQKSPFFRSGPGHCTTLRVSIETLEAQIGEIDGQISRLRGG